MYVINNIKKTFISNFTINNVLIDDKIKEKIDNIRF